MLHRIKTAIINFADKLNSQQDLASRQKQLNYYSILSYLPDPDPVLKAKGKDISIYRELLTDPHLSAMIEKRKAGVLSMEWEIQGSGSNKREVKFFTDYFNSIKLDELIGLILECVYYGYQPFAVYWDLIDGRRIPRVEDRPQEYFFFDTENQLRIKLLNDPNGILAEDLQFLLARNKPTYLNPYGDRIASKVFWPITFKKGGFKFWLMMTEKYGMPFLVGKVPKGTKPTDQTKLADMLQAMIQNAVAVINDTDNVEILESSGKVGSAGLYEKLVEFCNKEITKAVLTVTNTVELQQGSGSYAASKTAREGELDVNLSDRKIVENTLNQLIEWTHRINFGTGASPKFILYQEEEVDTVIAERDQLLVKGVGIKFTKKYIKATYNLEEDDFDIADLAPDTNDVIKPATKKANFTEPIGKTNREKVDDLADSIPAQLLQLQIEQTLKPVMDLIKNSKDYSEVQDKLAELYPDMETSQLQSLLEKAIFVSELWGRVNNA